MDQPRSLWELAATPAPDTTAPAGTPERGTPDEPPAPPAPRIVGRALDVAIGRPAAGITVVFETVDAAGTPVALGTAVTDANGVASPPDAPPLAAGYYRVTFDLGRYFDALHVSSCYPAVSVLVAVTDPTRDFEVPLLLSPNGYSTWRA